MCLHFNHDLYDPISKPVVSAAQEAEAGDHLTLAQAQAGYHSEGLSKKKKMLFPDKTTP